MELSEAVDTRTLICAGQWRLAPSMSPPWSMNPADPHPGPHESSSRPVLSFLGFPHRDSGSIRHPTPALPLWLFLLSAFPLPLRPQTMPPPPPCPPRSPGHCTVCHLLINDPKPIFQPWNPLHQLTATRLCPGSHPGDLLESPPTQ